MQPIIRGGHRLGHVLWRRGSLPHEVAVSETSGFAKRISATECDLYWQSRAGQGREGLLEATLHEAQRVQWPAECGDGWVDWDVRLMGDRWHDVLVRTATEELGGWKRFTRARSTSRPTWLAKTVATMSLLSAVAALAGGQTWAMAAALALSLAVLARLMRSRRQCLQASAWLLAAAAVRIPLERVRVSGARSESEDVSLPQPVLSVEREVEAARSVAAHSPMPALCEE
jgi:hypothetical protein